MKVLCTTDFSNASLDACRWIVQMLRDREDAHLELLHCMNVVSRALVFTKVNDVFKKFAEKDINALKSELQPLAPALKITTRLARLDPKSFITKYAEREGFDLIVTGTKGLSALKEVTVGSVTAHVMNQTDIPVLVIPEEVKYQGLRKVVLGIDADGESALTLAPLVRMLEGTQAKLEVIHAEVPELVPAGDLADNLLPLGNLNYTFQMVPEERSVPDTLTNYSADHQADMMVMVHRKRKFLERLFVGSYTREELFIIQTPLLILPQV
jgi:nucleotide-binding universal stress UspA family protein